MKFVLGPIPEDPTFEPEKSGWRSLREPSPVMINILAIPIMIVWFIAIWFVIKSFTPVTAKGIVRPFLPALLIIIPLHEGLHALVTPRFGTTRNTLVGCWPAMAVFFAHYEGEMTRERFLAVLLAPTIALTVIPLIVISTLSLHAPWLAAAALANGLAAAGDHIGAFLTFIQVPRGAIVRNKGWRTYWKRPAFLTTPRLILRPVEKSDTDQLHALWCDADIRRYLWDDAVIPRETAALVVQHNVTDWRDRGYGLFTALDRETGELAGFVGFRSSAERAEPELLFAFHPRFWHRGLATEAVRAVLAWLGRPVWAATDPPNVASIRLLERVGIQARQSSQA